MLAAFCVACSSSFDDCMRHGQNFMGFYWLRAVLESEGHCSQGSAVQSVVVLHRHVIMRWNFSARRRVCSLAWCSLGTKLGLKPHSFI